MENNWNTKWMKNYSNLQGRVFQSPMNLSQD